jgi:hypothetical protein
MVFKRLLKVGVTSAILIVLLQLLLPLTPVTEWNVAYVPAQGRVEDGSVLSTVTEADASTSSASAYREHWEDASGLVVTINPGFSSNYNYTWKVAADTEHQDQIAYYQSFDEEIAKYDKKFLKSAGLKRVILVDDITMNSNGQAVLGFADILTGDLYLNIDGARAQTGLIKSTIHHEIGHMAFYAAYGSSMYDLQSWPSVSNYSETTSSYSSGYSFPVDGYVSTYAQTSVAEDMAEVYSYIMTDEYNGDLQSAIEADSVIAQKVTNVKSAISLVDSSFTLPI